MPSETRGRYGSWQLPRLRADRDQTNPRYDVKTGWHPLQNHRALSLNSTLGKSSESDALAHSFGTGTAAVFGLETPWPRSIHQLAFLKTKLTPPLQRLWRKSLMSSTLQCCSRIPKPSCALPNTK